MGKFKSINYSRVVCEDCGQETIIEPGMVFNDLNCKCKDEKKSEELSTPFNEIKLYAKGDGTTVELIGEFENGDVEVQYEDGTTAYRIPKETFETDFTEVSEESDSSNTVTLSLDDLKGKTPEEIKDGYNMDELRVLAKAVKIRGASQMNEDKLVGKLLAKAE